MTDDTDGPAPAPQDAWCADGAGGSGTEELTVVSARFEDPRAQVILLRGAVDEAAEDRLEAVFVRARSERCPLVVDLAGVTHGGVGLLALLLRARAGGDLTLVGPVSGALGRRMTVTGTHTLLDVQPTLTAALHRLRG